MPATKKRPRIVVVGGGFAGVKCAIGLALALENRADVLLVSAEPWLQIKPRRVASDAVARPDRLALAPLASRYGFGARLGQVVRVAPDSSRVALADGDVLAYDYLVLAAGAAMAPETVPGLSDHGFPYWQRQSPDAWFDFVAARCVGVAGTVLFAIAPGNACPDPIYTLIAMTDEWLRERGLRTRTELVLATHERFAGELFDTTDAEIVTAQAEVCLDRLYCNYRVRRVRRCGDVLVVDDDFGHTLPFSALLAAPPQRPALRLPGLVSDPGGFAVVQPETCQAPGYANVYVVGDLAAGSPKQAYRAVRQAEIAATDIAARVLDLPRPRLHFPPRGLANELGPEQALPSRAHWWN